jgi:hypothetical protein
MFILCICCQAAAAYGRGEKCRAAELSEKVVSLVNLLFTILKSTYSFQLLQIVHDLVTLLIRLYRLEFQYLYYF